MFWDSFRKPFYSYGLFLMAQLLRLVLRGFQTEKARMVKLLFCSGCVFYGSQNFFFFFEHKLHLLPWIHLFKKRRQVVWTSNFAFGKFAGMAGTLLLKRNTTEYEIIRGLISIWLIRQSLTYLLNFLFLDPISGVSDSFSRGTTSALMLPSNSRM